MRLAFDLTDDLTRLLKEADQVAAQWADRVMGLDNATQHALHRQARISTIGASTRIENALLTDAQVDWIDTVLSTDGRPTAFQAYRSELQDKLSKDRERSLEEVAGCREMVDLIYSQGAELSPFTPSALRELHRTLLRYHSPAAYHLGKYKLVPNSVVERNAETGEERSVLETSDPGPITEVAVSDLLDWYNGIIPGHPWSVAVGSEFVFRFLACHPFQDGNGRIGRGLFLLTLLQSPEPYLRDLAPYLSIDRAIEQRRLEYYSALARTSQRYESDPQRYRLEHFLRFMLKVFMAALDGLDVSLKRIDAIHALPPAALQVLQCFREQPEGRLTPRAIVTATELPRRTVTDALGRLHALRLLQRRGRGPGTHYQLTF